MQKKHMGFSLLEVLIALVVISIALLGMTGVQAFVINNTGTARFSSLAAILANSMAASVNTNQAYWGGSTYGVPSGFQPATEILINGATLSHAALNNLSKNCSSSECNPDEMAAYDLKTWGQLLNQQLPNGTAQINCKENSIGIRETSSQYICTIKISWFEKNIKTSLNKNTTVPKFTKQSYTLVVQQ